MTKPPRVVVLAATVVVAILVVTASYYYLVVSAPANSVTVTIAANGGPQGDTVGFLPTNFTVKEGQHVTLVLDNKDTNPHELQIPEFDVSTGVVQGGKTERVSFVPDKTGTFGYGQVASYCIEGPAPNCPVFGVYGNITVLSP